MDGERASIETAPASSFPVGGGELGELIRNHDWASTSLGPIETWPQSLKTATDIVLQSPLPIVMLWGLDGIMIYNDPYSVFAGQRHPRLLGSKVLEGWVEVAEFNAEVMRVGLAGGTLSFKDQELTLYRNNRPEQVWMDLNYSPVMDESGKPAGVLAIVVETTGFIQAERQRLEAEAKVRESEERFRALVNATSDVVYRMSPDWTEMRALDGRGFLADTETPSVAWLDEYLFDEDQAAVLEVVKKAIEAKDVFQLEHRLRRADGSAGWTLSRAIPLLAEHGEIIEWFGAASDITGRREAEEHLRLVINELNHRVKNNLAIIQAIGAQTFRKVEDLPKAQAIFVARIQALAKANDLLTNEHWVDASMEVAIETALQPHRPDDASRGIVEGPPIRLSAKTALSLSMAFHELATNAVKYGAWSNEAGKVSVTWNVDVSDAGRRLKLEWRENGGPPVTAPPRRGFGSRLIERGLAAELEGEVKMTFEPEGMVCRVDAPLRAPDNG